jgi:hypothetical protein
MTEHGDLLRIDRVFAGCQRPAEQRRDAKHAEEVNRNSGALDSLGFSIAREIESRGAVRREQLEGACTISIQGGESFGDVDLRQPFLRRRAPERHEAVGRLERQRSKQDSVDRAEDQRAGADADCQRRDGDG